MVTSGRFSYPLRAALFLTLALIVGAWLGGFVDQSRTVNAQDTESVMEMFRRGLQEYRLGNYGQQAAGGHGPGAMHWFQRVRMALQGMDDAEEMARLCQALIQEAGDAQMIQMASLEYSDVGVREDIRGFASYLMSGALGQGIEQSRVRPDIVRALHQYMRTGDLRWQFVLAQNFGEFAVPEIHRAYLHCRNSEYEAKAVHLLTVMGRQVVMPVIEIMDSSITADRVHAAQVLGALGDTRAVPALLAHYQNPAERTVVKEECRIALSAILGSVEGPADLPDAKSWYYNMAMRYYHHAPELMFSRTDSFVVWRWVPMDPDGMDLSQGGYLDYDHQIPVWAYADICAEEACLDALSLDQSYDEAWDLLTTVTLRQELEARTREQVADSREQRDFSGVFDRGFRGQVLGGTLGQEVLYRVIRRAMADREPEMAILAMEKLQQIGDETFVPQASDYDSATRTYNTPGAPLMEALQSGDRRVSYAAAQTLFALSHARQRSTDQAPFANIDMAKNIIIRGIGESSTRNILVITNDRDLRNNLREELERLGYFTYFAETPRDGLVRALSFPADDMILLDSRIGDQPVRLMRMDADEFTSADIVRRETIFGILRRDFRTRDLPIVLMADLDRSGEEDRVRSLYADPIRNQMVHEDILNTHQSSGGINAIESQIAIFEPIWDDRQDDAAFRADRIAIDSAVALKDWNPDSFPPNFLNNYVEALVARVHQSATPTNVKVAMLQALDLVAQANDRDKYPTEFWNERVLANLLPLLSSPDSENPPMVKGWVCVVMGHIYQNHPTAMWEPGVTPTRDPEANPFWALYNLVEYTVDAGELDDEDTATLDEDVAWVRVMAGNALGNAPMDRQQAYFLQSTRRINQKVGINYGGSDMD